MLLLVARPAWPFPGASETYFDLAPPPLLVVVSAADANDTAGISGGGGDAGGGGGKAAAGWCAGAEPAPGAPGAGALGGVGMPRWTFTVRSTSLVDMGLRSTSTAPCCLHASAGIQEAAKGMKEWARGG